MKTRIFATLVFISFFLNVYVTACYYILNPFIDCIIVLPTQLYENCSKPKFTFTKFLNKSKVLNLVTPCLK